MVAESSWRKRDRDVSRLEPKTLEGKFVGYTEGKNGYLMYLPNSRKVVAVRDVIIKESEVGSTPDNTETPELLDEGSQQRGIWQPDDGHQEDGNKHVLGTSTEIKEWPDAESVNTQETTLREDASDVEEAALDEETTATRGSLGDSESLEDSERRTSHSRRQLASLRRHWSKRTGQSTDEQHEQGIFRIFLENAGPILV